MIHYDQFGVSVPFSTNPSNPLECKYSTNSSTHPITVSWVMDHGGGKLGLSYCPGKKLVRDSVAYNRDLATDLKDLENNHHITAVVCLLSDAELRAYKVRDYGKAVIAKGLQYVQYPIMEMGVPDKFDAAAEVIENIVQLMEDKQAVLVHCKGGVGRAGLVAACVLLRTGQCKTAAEAIAEVRDRRCPDAVETSRQEDFVAKYALHLQSKAGEAV
jgi:cyclin-dependent kinase inhibitor 3